MDQVRNLMRLKHLSYKTERAYVSYIRDYILFHKKRHLKDMGVGEVRAFLTHLAAGKNVAAFTQNVAFNSILFFYKQVLQIELPIIDRVLRAKRPRHLPIFLRPVKPDPLFRSSKARLSSSSACFTKADCA